MLNFSDFKLSKYNFFMQNESMAMIFYNHLYKQLCKFPAEYYERIQKCLLETQKGTAANVDDLAVFQELRRRNAILPLNFDEEAVSNLHYMNEITKDSLCLIIYPTLACNFRCPYCYQSHENNNMDAETATGIISYVRKNISKYRELHVAWFGGEPLLKLDLIQQMSSAFIDICHKRNRLYTSAITTNGYFMNKDVFLKLYSNNVRKFAVTIDGLAEIHDRQRITVDGKGSFNKIISNLLEIKSISSNLKFEMNIRSNVSKEGLQRLEPYVKYMSELFADDDRFCFSFRPVYDWGGDSIQSFRDHLLDDFVGCKNLYDFLYVLDYPMNYYQHYEEITNSSICYASREHTFAVEPDGRLSKCTSANRESENYFVGAIDKLGNMQLDKNLVAQWANPYHDKASCKDCFFEASCHSNFCVLDKVLMNSRKTKCPGGKMYIKEYIKLLDKNNDRYHYIEEVNMEQPNEY